MNPNGDAYPLATGPTGATGAVGATGEPGEPGVYVGGEAPTNPGAVVWVNPDGDGYGPGTVGNPIPLPFYVSDGTTTWMVGVSNGNFSLMQI